MRFFFFFLLHFGLFTVLFLVGLDFSVIDGKESGLVSRIAHAFGVVLGQPALYFAGFLPTPRHDVLEWALLVSNSLLWAAVLRALSRRLNLLA